MTDHTRNLLWRALHTAWQTFSVAFLVPDSWWDVGAWKSIAFAGLASALSAAKTFIGDYLAARNPG